MLNIFFLISAFKMEDIAHDFENGWSKITRSRQGGASWNRLDVYIISPDETFGMIGRAIGKKLRSTRELAEYIMKNNMWDR